MSKYIDADKLIAEIERRLALLKGVGSKGDYAKGSIDADTGILKYIASLQQEQPESICPRCIYRNKTDDSCEYPSGGRNCLINENGVYECNGFEEVEQQEQSELPSDIDKAAEDSWAEYEYRESPRGLYSTCYVDGFKAGAEWQREQYECIPAEEAYMRGFAQGAKEERESLSPTMLTYAADVFSGKMLLEDISYSYRQELADYFRDLAKTAKATNARKEESK